MPVKYWVFSSTDEKPVCIFSTNEIALKSLGMTFSKVYAEVYQQGNCIYGKYADPDLTGDRIGYLDEVEFSDTITHI